MEEEKTKLRDALFRKYFEVENSVNIVEVLEQLKPLIKIWGSLDTLLKQTIKDYEWFDGVEIVRFVTYQGVEYFIIKMRMFKYFIVDIKEKKVLTKENVASLFTEDFFVNYFEEIQLEMKSDYIVMYHFLECKQGLEELLGFCKDKQEYLEMPNRIYCRFEINDAWTYLNINISTKEIQLGFQTPDQTLYDFLHFGIDLVPWGMQDAQQKVGLEKMKEICEKVKYINIPLSSLPVYAGKEEIIKRERNRK